MADKLPLLDQIAENLNLLYLSELSSYVNSRSEKVSEIYETVSSVQSGDYDVREWNEVLGYLFRISPEETAEAARTELLRALKEHTKK